MIKPSLNSNSTSFESVGFEFKISKKMVLQEEGAMFIFVFCGVFTLMLLVILVLVCKHLLKKSTRREQAVADIVIHFLMRSIASGFFGEGLNI
ncbi:hypothetical protein PRIPAC_97328 [Pristionchus pacificus]|uniref:Uncharacterized protein n=1 Tax=Pristionchus pacificus TaxID=54126 RepID=A0A2A6CH52_PRIPA|nr:hypothetical protein PRIPAC_97328 [Pristionchus pacificus]|eukprot:PDM77351.1 hypothetical protein PRIPAC_33081 [Pristionchus pacificus]